MENNYIEKGNNTDFIIFKTEDEKIAVDVLLEKSKSTISEHIKHVFEEGELDKGVVVRKFRTTTQHGAIEGKTQENNVNLSAIV